MSIKFYKYLFLFLLIISASCAKRGSIDGGRKDTLAPVLKMSFPKNGTVNFTGKEIKLVFDEYVKLKGVEKQLIISPPMKQNPEILPTSASKFIIIKIKDTLKPNTTYSMNFGQSIEDNNESNAYKQFKYVFSTGKYIDSLSIGGSIKDAINKKVDNFVSVMLYEVDEKYKDSVVYKQNPRYITNTLDSLKSFRIENIKAGKYSLVAIKDKNANNKFDSRDEKIGFQKQFITIPNDTVFQLELFKEVLPLKILKPKQASGNRIIIPYEGNPKDLKIVLKNGSETLPTIISKFDKKDSLQVWYKPLKVDSLKLSVAKNKYSEDFIVKIKNQKKDTLSFNPIQIVGISFRENYLIHASRPIINIDNTKIQLLNKDSIAVNFTSKYDEYNQNIILNFKKEPLEKYKIKLFPGAISDYLDKKNDTLKYKIETKNLTDYGNLSITLEKVKKYPLIIQLTDNTGKVYATAISEKQTTIDFNLIDPAKYTLRVIYDDNENQEYDPGNFLEKRQSEEVIYYPKEIDVRANWDVSQPFDLSK
ncbi:MAG: Ig-like domain-containing protein [Flavobacterium sp.]|nr:Ig-like domain-containing protein [Flavobacterium sp.]